MRGNLVTSLVCLWGAKRPQAARSVVLCRLPPLRAAPASRLRRLFDRVSSRGSRDAPRLALRGFAALRFLRLRKSFANALYRLYTSTGHSTLRVTCSSRPLGLTPPVWTPPIRGRHSSADTIHPQVFTWLYANLAAIQLRTFASRAAETNPITAASRASIVATLLGRTMEATGSPAVLSSASSTSPPQRRCDALVTIATHSSGGPPPVGTTATTRAGRYWRVALFV